jgi:hypothetical protein
MTRRGQALFGVATLVAHLAVTVGRNSGDKEFGGHNTELLTRIVPGIQFRGHEPIMGIQAIQGTIF